MFDIELRNVYSAYLEFLYSYDPKVPLKESRPWLYPVEIDGINYAIPLTTSSIRDGYAGFIRCVSTGSAGLNLNYMVPAAEAAMRPARELPEDLQRELDYYHDIEKYIVAEARILRQLSESGGIGKLFQEHSVNFKDLETIHKFWYPGLSAGLFLSHKEDSMAISKTGNQYYTKDELEAARKNSSALDYAMRQGYPLVKEQGYYRMKDHDSLVFRRDGTFFWNSRQVKGDAIDFQVHYEGKTIVEAVLTLAGSQHDYTQPRTVTDTFSPDSNAEEKTLTMPAKSVTCRQLFGYLCAGRGLEKEIVQEMIRQGRLYQNTVTLERGTQLQNAVFVYRDNKDNIVGGFKRGMNNRPGDPPYKRAVYNSNKDFGWILAGKKPADTVCVFEAAIDAASHASLDIIAGRDWRTVDRLSMEGLNPAALEQYLKDHPNVTKIKLMLDADAPGRQASAQMLNALREKGYSVEELTPPRGKDWNDSLKAYRENETQLQQERQTQEQEAPEEDESPDYDD